MEGILDACQASPKGELPADSHNHARLVIREPAESEATMECFSCLNDTGAVIDLGDDAKMMNKGSRQEKGRYQVACDYCKARLPLTSGSTILE